jgi:hypothetical protein
MGVDSRAESRSEERPIKQAGPLKRESRFRWEWRCIVLTSSFVAAHTWPTIGCSLTDRVA